MTVREEIARDTAAAIQGYGSTFEWNGVANIPCVRVDEPSGLEITEAGGEIDTTIYMLTVSKGAFPDFDTGVFPKIGDGVNYGSCQVKFIKGHKDPAAVNIVLTVGSFDT